MTVTATIAGVSYGIMTNSIQPENRVDDRDTLTISVLDTAGTALFQKYQPVVLTDSILGTIFTGIINTPTMQQILWPANQKIWQLQCVDQAYRLDKELSDWTYKNQYAGTIFAHQLQTYSAADHVSAEFALRWEELMSAWAQGTLSGTSATTNTSTGNPGAGDLELSSAGSTVTTGAINTSTSGTNALHFTGYASSGYNTAYAYREIWTGSQAITTGDTFSYDVWIASSSPAIMSGVGFMCSDGTRLTSQSLTDPQGLSVAPTTDLSGIASDQWYTRTFTMPSALNGKSIVSVQVFFAGTSAGTYNSYFRNINYSAMAGWIFGPNSTLTTNVQTSTIGYTNVALTQVVAGNKIQTLSQSLGSIASVGIVQSSQVSWNQVVPSGCSVVVQTSVNSGTSYQTVTSGQAIPNLTVGMIPAYSLAVLVTFTLGSDPTATISITGLQATVTPAYASSKSDVTDSWLGQLDFQGGTFTNTVWPMNSGSTFGITLNGSQRNWDDASISNQTLYGSVSPAQSVARKQFALTSGSGAQADAKSQLNFAGQWQNFTCEVDVSVPATGVNCQAGIVYRTTYWASPGANTNGTYAYTVMISTTQVQLAYGSNSSTNSFTSLATASLSLATNSLHRLKVVVNGSTHQIYLDGALLITKTDSTYTAAGYIGLRVFNNSGSTQTCTFDNFGVVASLSGTWQSSSISIAGASTYGGSLVQWDTNNLPDNTTSISVQTSVDGGTTWQSVSNGGAISNLTVGQSLSGKSLLLLVTLTAQNASLVPQMQGITAWVFGQYSSTGTRSTAPLGWDSFTRANQSGWGTSTNQQTWTVESGSGTVALSSDAGTITNTGASLTVLQLGNQVATDQSVTCRVKFGLSGAGAHINGRYSSASSGSFYSLYLTASGTIGIQKVNSGAFTTLGSASFSVTLGAYYWLHLVVQGTTINGNVWLDGTNEPSGYMLSYTDSSIASGGFGVAASLAAGDTATFNSFRATQYPDPSTSLVPVGRAANSLINWNANLPSNTSLAVQTSVDNGVTWSTISAAGNAIPGLTLQPAATVDDYSADSHTSYTTTNGVGGSAATWTWDTPNKRLQAVGGSKAVALYNGVTVTDVDMFVDIYQSENAGLVWRWSDAASDYYELIVTDSAASSPNVMTLNKVVAGTLTVLASSTGTFTFPTQTHHYVRVTMLGSAITCYFDGVSILTVTDASLASGSVGVRNDTGTSYYYYLYIQPQGQDVSSAIPGANTVCTKLTLSTTDPTATPQVTDLQAMVGGPTFWPGVIIPTATYNSATSFVSSNAEDLKNQSDYFWSMADEADAHGNYDVSFQPREATPAPWPLDENNYQMIAGQQINDILLAGIGQVYGADLYRNRMVIKNAIATSAYDQIFIGDGKATSWTLTNPIVAAPTAWTLNGLPVSFGLQGVDTGKQFYYQIGSTSITADSSQSVLTDTDSLEIKYSGSSVVDVTRDNLSIPGTITQSALAAITGDSGIVTAAVDVSGQNMSVAAAETYGDQMLARYGVIGVTFNFTTLRSGLREGQQLMLYTPHFNLNKILTLVTDVRLSQQVAPGVNGGVLWAWQVTAQTGPALGSWVKMLSLGLSN